MRYFGLLIYALSFLLFSCNNKPDVKTYLSKIDSLSLSLEESASAYKDIDTAEIRQYYVEIETQINELKDYNNIINTSPVISYNKTKNNFNDFLKTYPVLMHELKYTKAQLSDLKHDIENRNLNQDNLSLYMDQERQSVYVLKLKMDHYSQQLKLGMINYNRLNPEIKTLTDSLYRKNEIY